MRGRVMSLATGLQELTFSLVITLRPQGLLYLRQKTYIRALLAFARTLEDQYSGLWKSERMAQPCLD